MLISVVIEDDYEDPSVIFWQADDSMGGFQDFVLAEQDLEADQGFWDFVAPDNDELSSCGSDGRDKC